MSYAQSDFKGCVIPPLQKSLLANNPKLKELIPIPGEEDEPIGDAETEKIFRYIILLYDPQSTLVKNERDLNNRKQQAAVLAGLKDDPDYLETIYNSTHPLIVPLAVGYLMKFAKSKEWAAICAFESTFWESIRKLMEPISGRDSKAELESVEKKAKIKAEVDADIIRLEQYYYKFLGEDASLEEKAKPKLTPEGMAKMFK